ncbi:EF-hand domain-containing protein [Desulfocurvibacter africanus]|uniref:EF-hand domain-containing protein n=1 Tax=Desulfocurvibacter africanus TaxID=873 RepID=UPI0003FA91A6|nr:EF-hand domain-containing protein [Desulfocurvibacter africanus]
MYRLPFAATCAMMLSLVGAAHSADVAGEEGIADWSLFESMDADRNGWISQLEFQGYCLDNPEAQPPFADIDTDQNGTVSWQEWAFSGAEESETDNPESQASTDLIPNGDGSRPE